MPVQGVEDVALPQVPDLQSRVVAARKQVAAIGMEVDLVHFRAVGIVVLDQSLASNVPDLDGAILAAAGHARAVGMEAHGVDATIVVNERIDALA